MTSCGEEINDACVLEQIHAMLSHEDKTTRCHNHLTSQVDASSRKAMVDWFFAVVDAFGLSRESVNVSFSILDRYLSSGRGQSQDVLQSKQLYQKASITCLYTAIKLHEPAQLGLCLLTKLCRGYYKEEDITDMEQDILEALEWRVYMSTTTPMEYMRQYLELLPEWDDVKDVIIENGMLHLDSATSDIYFSTCKASEVGIACLAGALNDTFVLSAIEKDLVWRQLSKKLEFDIASNEIREIEKKLLATSTSCEPKRQSKASSLPRSSIQLARGQSSSPVSVLQMAR